MRIEENGTVVEVRGATALIRLRRSSACGGCASAGHCHAGRGENEQLLEARNEAGAAVGDVVRVAVPARAVISASMRTYLLPIGGLLIGAALAQVTVTALISQPAGANAAGLGGLAGAVLAVLLARRLGKPGRAAATALPQITRIVSGEGFIDAPDSSG